MRSESAEGPPNRDLQAAVPGSVETTPIVPLSEGIPERENGQGGANAVKAPVPEDANLD